ncbi:hypothetical protein SS1G_08477 [Sclerotinia sclerotiorum 1980 UF-70]|uniref:Uncharacterized protein n=2 Tax=Sclerotinia sclerotiorum (strain ATCC 18683 / 1980 / Ss-1) TaxID=665079 RepID=A7ET22_SCLS1|nr:hypothetical protein SS1G_08477 [Sclerotinia sclerotiorum 1980 UF-70]APA12983.1 hypothetical protein sscle_10g077530 [Sclerotinia sclerotiorum 1980 UF-70]EDN92614.1 hypothetical protein SS1G_08477 [Sclerotinia sclerotiorum 1980 UF-70]
MEQAPPSLPQLFGIIPTGQPPIITPTSAPSPTSFVFTLPARSYNHICVFLLPGITLPHSTAAAVYISLPPSLNASTPASTPPFKFLGGIGPGKESAIFKINSDTTPQNSNPNPAPEIDMDADSNPSSLNPQAEITLGISLESADSVSAQMAQLSSSSASPSSINPSNPSTSLILSRPSQNPKTDTLVLAQRIIKNAFNFLASFSGNVMDGGNGKGVEVVPLKAFEEWWRKFEVRVRNDPGFLERDGD